MKRPGPNDTISQPRPYQALGDFDPRLPLTDPKNLAALADASVKAYDSLDLGVSQEPDKKFIYSRELETKDGWNIQYMDFGGSSQAYIAADRNTGNIFVIFRGTKEPADLITDGNPSMQRVDHGKVRKGFHDALEERTTGREISYSEKDGKRSEQYGEKKVFYDTLRDNVRQLQREMGAGRSHLYLTGHSLGGAVVEECASRLVQDGVAIDGLVTFGQPTGGDRTHAVFNNKLFGNKIVQVWDTQDIVPEMGAGAGISRTTRGIAIHHGQLRGDLSPDEWAERYMHSTFKGAVGARFSSHSSLNGYHRNLEALAAADYNFSPAQEQKVLDYFQERGMNPQNIDNAQLRQLGSPTQIYRTLLDNKETLLEGGLHSRSYEVYLGAMKDYVSQTPQWRQNEGYNPYSRSSLREEYTDEHPFSPVGIHYNATSFIDKIPFVGSKTKVAMGSIGQIASDMMMDLTYFTANFNAELLKRFSPQQLSELQKSARAAYHNAPQALASFIDEFTDERNSPLRRQFDLKDPEFPNAMLSELQRIANTREDEDLQTPSTPKTQTKERIEQRNTRT